MVNKFCPLARFRPNHILKENMASRCEACNFLKMTDKMAAVKVQDLLGNTAAEADTPRPSRSRPISPAPTTERLRSRSVSPVPRPREILAVSPSPVPRPSERPISPVADKKKITISPQRKGKIVDTSPKALPNPKSAATTTTPTQKSAPSKGILKKSKSKHHPAEIPLQSSVLDKDKTLVVGDVEVLAPTTAAAPLVDLNLNRTTPSSKLSSTCTKPSTPPSVKLASNIAAINSKLKLVSPGYPAAANRSRERRSRSRSRDPGYTFGLLPYKPFSRSKVRICIENVLKEMLGNIKYEGISIATGKIADKIRSRILELQFDGCKIVVLVHICPVKGQGLTIGSRSIWSPNDSVAFGEFKNSSLYAGATVYGVY